MATNLVPKVPLLFVCNNCNKKYKHHSSLWKHNKNNCNNLKNEVNHTTPNNNNNNNNNDLIQYLMNENKEFKNLILEIVKKDSITNNNNINSHNKTFNLQIFLNETCKDAMNMSDFIDSMKLQLSDLESVGKLGFVDGISNIIINNLKALDIEKRPVHCSDAKRETMYIKDQDRWEKEGDELNRMKQMVRQVRDKNISLITSWRDLYPECLMSNSNKTDQYNNICTESFGFKKDREEKIISKIAKSVIIDKT
jgi:signal peptidase I